MSGTLRACWEAVESFRREGEGVGSVIDRFLPKGLELGSEEDEGDSKDG